MLTRLTPLDGEAILSLADGKEQCSVRHSDTDALIAALRDAAIAHVERASGVALAESQWRWSATCFPARFDLPMRPVISVEGVAYQDSAGESQAYADWRLIEASVYPEAGGSWPTAYDYAAVEFTAGLASPDDAPDLIAAVRLMVAHLFDQRAASSEKAITELPLGVSALIGTHRQIYL